MQTNINDIKRWAATKRITSIGFGVVTVIWLLIAGLTYLITHKAMQDGDLVTHTYVVLQHLEGLLVTLTDAESEQRGYLITGNPRYLELNKAASTVLLQQISALRQLTKDNDIQRQKLDMVEPLIVTRLDLLRQGIHLRDEQGFEAAQAFVLNSQGKAVMDNIRTLVGQMDGIENDLLRERIDQSRVSSRTMILGISGGILISFGLFAAIFLVLNRQIATRIRIEEALENERNLLRTLIDHLPDMVYVKNIESQFISNNARHWEVLGVSGLAEIVGKTDFDFFPHELAAQYLADEQAIIRTGQPLNEREERAIDKAGRTYWMMTTKVPLCDKRGQITGIVGISRDITERKQMEDALRVSEEQFRTSVEAMVDGFAIFSAMRDEAGQIIDFRYEYINVVGCQLNQRSREEHIGHTLLELFPEQKPTGLFEEYTSVVETGQSLIRDSLVYEDVYGGGQRLTRAYDVRLTKLGDGFVVIWRDVTERKRAEEEIQRLNADLKRRAAALEAANQELESCSYSVSHDLRAPLRAINGFSRILLEEYAPQLNAEAVSYLQKVQNNGQRMGDLIDDLLTFSRLSRQPLKKQTVSLAELVRHVFEELRSEQDDRRIELVISDLPPCQADPALLRQVILNLLGNALKFTNKRDVARIEIGYQQANGVPVFFIRDNGTGFDMQYANKLFGVFQRLHSAQEYPGTGVGLAIVQRVIARHGGRVWADSAINQGATFYFTVEASHA
ncbi:MAG: CHASE3 domain-containing protein [Anaerolineae bacterium]|nr:CHASE3 domain-containing protein [Anaerolineae bacterium]